MAHLDLSLEQPIPRPAPAKRRTGRHAFLIVLLLLLAVTVYTYANFQTVVVRGSSMETSYHDGQRLLVTRAYWLFGSPTVGDVVVLREADNPHAHLMVKRVAGLPGDVVPPYLSPTGRPEVIGPKQVFVLGDNVAVSEDSRRFGPVPMGRIMGKVVTR